VLFGPSGSGKSTILRALCRLLRSNNARSGFYFCPSFGESAVQAANPNPTTEWHSLNSTPPHRRNLAYAPQGAILFPHLSVRENIAFATQARHQTNPQLIDTAINLFDLAQLTNRRPRTRSHA
jgi:ABC-type Fe3+/spermidine/putrescine transport system ATPase subunit